MTDNPFLSSSSPSSRPFLTGASTPNFFGMFGGGSSQASMPVTALPADLVDPNNPKGPTWEQLPDFLKATNRPAYVQMMTSVKRAGYKNWDEVLIGAGMAQIPVWDFLDKTVQDNAAYYKASGAGGGGGPFSNTQTNTTVSSESSAAQIADQVWQQELGRRASDDEIAAFRKALNAAQAQSPSVSKTTGVSAGSNTTSSTTTSTGFDPTRFAVEYAQSRPDYAENFAATSFMDLLDRAISKPDALSSAIGAKSG